MKIGNWKLKIVSVLFLALLAGSFFIFSPFPLFSHFFSSLYKLYEPYNFMNSSSPDPLSPLSPDDGTTVTPPFPAPKVIGDKKFYQNLLLKFSVTFPGAMSIKEYGKGSGSTIVFADEKTGKSFQVFVVPYSEDFVTAERFKMDAPLGVMKEPKDITIDGVPATIFWSQDATMGETREVWFVHNGFLYEVTTFAELDPMLSEVMATWKFLSL